MDWPSVQVLKDTWTDYYSFAILNSGLNTGFELTDIAAVTGAGPAHTGAPDITRIDPAPGPSGPYFIDPNVPQSSPDFVDGIGIAPRSGWNSSPGTGIMRREGRMPAGDATLGIRLRGWPTNHAGPG